MAVEEHRGWTTGLQALKEHRVAQATQRLAARMAVAHQVVRRVWQAAAARAPLRFLFSSIGRRIFIANLLGLMVLVVGIFWLGNQQSYIEGKAEESLKIQGEIIAAAIAANAFVDRQNDLVFEPDRLPEIQGARIPLRDDGFASHEVTLRPVRVVSTVRRLVTSSGNTRIRVYDRSGRLVVDSKDLLNPQFAPPPEPEESERVRVRDWWTRLVARFDSSKLPVYREIGRANGRSYAEVAEALSGKRNEAGRMKFVTEDRRHIFALAVPIERRGVVLGALLLSTKPGEIDRIANRALRALLILVLLALAASLLTTWLLSRTIAGPLHRLSIDAEKVTNDVKARTGLEKFGSRQDEIGQLSRAIGQMTASLLRRVDSSERFAADVAHELKNPLTAAQGLASSLQYARTQEQRDEVVQEIIGELKRLDRLITDVSRISRLDAQVVVLDVAPVDLRTILRTTVAQFIGPAEQAGLTLKLDVNQAEHGPDAFEVLGDKGLLPQVFSNLVSNAISFSPAGGTVSIRVRRRGPNVEVSVIDDGPGIPEGSIDKIFERFYSDRPQSDATAGKNSGLGLSISRTIVNAHKGRIWAENRKDAGRIVGARFRVALAAAHPIHGRRARRREQASAA